MRFAGAFVPAFADDFFVVNDHAAYKRIGIGTAQPVLGQFYAAAHEDFVAHALKLRVFRNRNLKGFKTFEVYPREKFYF
jgi:hypothetical protein